MGKLSFLQMVASKMVQANKLQVGDIMVNIRKNDEINPLEDHGNVKGKGARQVNG